MPVIRPTNAHRAGRARPVGPRCRGGASSLLRLAQPGWRRLPSAVELGGWMHRAASMLTPPMPVTGLHVDTGTPATGRRRAVAG